MFVDLNEALPYLNNPAFICAAVRERQHTTCYAVMHAPVRSVVSGNTGN